MPLLLPDGPPVSRVARPIMADSRKLWLVPMEEHLTSLDPPLSPALHARVMAEFGSYMGKGEYPVQVGNQLIDLLCAEYLGDQPVAEARRQLGYSYNRSFRRTILGRVMMAALPLMGPGMERVLRLSPSRFAATANYGTRWVAEVAPHHWRFDWEDEILYPEWIQGILEFGGHEILRLPNLQIRYTILAAKHFSFAVTW